MKVSPTRLHGRSRDLLLSMITMVSSQQTRIAPPPSYNATAVGPVCRGERLTSLYPRNSLSGTNQAALLLAIRHYHATPVALRSSDNTASNMMHVPQQKEVKEEEHKQVYEEYGSSSAVASSRAATVAIQRSRQQSPDEVRALFLRSVQARTIGNKQLKAFIESADPVTEWQAVEAAVDGARQGGLRPNAHTNEVLLALYVDGGRLKQALELYGVMSKERLTPTTQSYNTLMRLCLDRDMVSSVQSLFDDMKKRGRAANGESYELLLSALATENPPRWERAVEIFEKMNRTAHYSSVHGATSVSQATGSGPVRITTGSYIALMTVYGNMQPFDWRVVYNCYFELRQKHPHVPLSWEAYAVVAKNLRKGRAGVFRRVVTYADAWFALTHIKTLEFWGGLCLFIALMMCVKGLLSFMVLQYKESWDATRQQNAQNVIHM